MPITRSKEEPLAAPPQGGTPRGNTFISSGHTCWWMWALRYLAGIVPAEVKEYLTFGSAYHAVLEGQSEQLIISWAGREMFDRAKALADLRLKKGPPLAAAHAIEKAHYILGGMMTSKPDREENGAIRDFKSAGMFSQYDQAFWDIEPGILGEMIAARVTRALVDVQHKGAQGTRIFEVKLTEKKKAALLGIVTDFWLQLQWRTERAKGASVASAFPRQLKNCVNKYGKCHYYDLCWGKDARRFLFQRTKNEFSWLKGKGIPHLALNDMKKLGEAVYAEAQKVEQ